MKLFDSSQQYRLTPSACILTAIERFEIGEISFARSFDLFYADILQKGGEGSGTALTGSSKGDGALSDSSTGAAVSNSVRQGCRRHKTTAARRLDRTLKSATGSPHRHWEDDAIAVSPSHSPRYHCVPSLWEKHVLAAQATKPENPLSSAAFMQDRISSAASTSASSPAFHRRRTSKSHHTFAKTSANRIDEPRCDHHHHVKAQHSESKICTMSEVDMLKERFAKLLLGEDMTGGGRGICSALAISNAITNLSGAVFGKLQCLQPLCEELKTRWRRETTWLLSVSDHIVEFHPSSQVLHDGNEIEIMITKPRSDLHINLPALRKLDTLLMEALDSFQRTEFWYVDRPMFVSEDAEHLQEEKSWPPIPRVPSDGLSHNTRKALQRQKDNIHQMLKAALAINIQVLNEMEVPATYWDGLPRNARLSLGERLYHTITATNFSPEDFVMSLDPGNNDIMLELVNRIEAALHIWRRKLFTRQTVPDGPHIQKTSWGHTTDGRARVRMTLVKKTESLLLLLRQRFPGLPQTTLDMSKIECNKDVGQSILESYSRALQNLACNILLLINDVLHVDDLQKRKLLVKPERSCFRHGGPFICSFTGGPSDFSSAAFPNPMSAQAIRTSVSPFLNPTSARSIRSSVSPRFLQTRFLGECMDPKMKVTIDATKQLQDGVHGEVQGP